MRITSIFLVASALFLFASHSHGLEGDCSCSFIRGDANNDGSVNLSDSTKILNYLFSGGSRPCNLDAADVDDNATVNQTDSIYLLCHLFGGMGCPNPPPAPKTPYPSAGCDCSPDDLEVCCSRSTGAFDPESLGVTSVFDCDDSGNTWDSPPSCTVNGSREVRIAASNNNSCAHANSTVFWSVTWQISDPHGVEDSAINDGCVKVDAKVRYRAGYNLGNECFPYLCEEDLPNELGTYPSDQLADYEFTFVDPATSAATILPSTSGSTPVGVFKRYAYDENCFIYTQSQTDVEDSTHSLASTSGKVFSTCKKLKYFKVKDVEYSFDKLGNADIAETEAITTPTSPAYSMRLLYIRYNWCNA